LLLLVEPAAHDEDKKAASLMRILVLGGDGMFGRQYSSR
jgi:hypothetical protein